jgi:hypothetical protein
MRATRFVAFLAVASALGFVASAQSDDGPTCGSSVVGSIVLTHDIGPCPGSGLLIETGDVTIDLNGHTIAGSGPGTGVQIDLDVAIHEVVVKNGSVEGFETGVSIGVGKNACLAPPATPIRVERVTARSNDRGVTVFGFPGCPVPITIERSRLVNNSSDGIRAALVDPIHILGNHIAGNGGTGISAVFDSVRRIDGNFVAHNGSDGIRIDDTVSSVSNNVMLKNGGQGLRILETVPSFIPHYVVSNNVADGNIAGGMSARSIPDPPGPPLGEGNAAKHNGQFDCILIACAKNRGEAHGSAISG